MGNAGAPYACGYPGCKQRFYSKALRVLHRWKVHKVHTP